MESVVAKHDVVMRFLYQIDNNSLKLPYKYREQVLPLLPDL